MSDLLTLFTGDLIRIRVTIADESTVNGLYDLSNTLQVTLSISKTSGTVLATKSYSPASGVVVGTATDGIIELTLTAAETEAITFYGRCILQIRVIEAAAEYTVVHTPIETRKVVYAAP